MTYDTCISKICIDGVNLVTYCMIKYFFLTIQNQCLGIRSFIFYADYAWRVGAKCVKRSDSMLQYFYIQQF